MTKKAERLSERWLVNLGAGSAVVLPISFIEALAADSWSRMGCFAVAAAVSLGILVFALRSSRYVPPGATKNTQLQQSPPALIQRGHDDA
jgi:hypothetical protein